MCHLNTPVTERTDWKNVCKVKVEGNKEILPYTFGYFVLCCAIWTSCQVKSLVLVNVGLSL